MARQVIDQIRSLAGVRDMRVARLSAAPDVVITCLQNGQAGQPVQDLVLADVQVPWPPGFRASGASVAVAAPVGGLAVGPRRLPPPPAPAAAQQPGGPCGETLQIITAAEANGHACVAEMNKQVAVNVDKIITALEADSRDERETVADAS